MLGDDLQRVRVRREVLEHVARDLHDVHRAPRPAQVLVLRLGQDAVHRVPELVKKRFDCAPAFGLKKR